MGTLENIFRAVAVSLGTAVTGLVIAAIKRLYKQSSITKEETNKKIEILCQANQDILSAQIVVLYEDALAKGYVTNLKLATAERLNNSYIALDGNHYIEDVMNNLRAMDVKGIDIKGL